MSTRITDLPQAETLNGSEVMPLVQNGVTKHATLDFINQAAPAALILQQTQQAYANTVVLHDETEALKTEFEAQYLGSFPAPPVLNNDGSTLTVGAIYWNTSISSMYVWNGAEWTAFSSPSMRVHAQRFSGDGIQTDFLMTLGVSSASLVDVFINGIYQNKNTFTVEDTLISFSEPPPSGTENVEVLIAVATAIGETDASLVSYKVTDDSETVRTVQSKLRETVSVKDFGAVGDGVTDDTVAIQAALNSGRAVIHAEGSFMLTATLTMSTPGQRLVLGSSRITLHAATASVRALDVTGDGAAVEGGTITSTSRQDFLLRLSGARSKAKATVLNYATPPGQYPMDEAMIVYNKGGVEMRGVGASVERVEAYNFIGIGVISYAANQRIERCILHHNGFGAHVDHAEAGVVTVHDNVFENNDSLGILANWDGVVLSFRNNTARGNGSHGAYLRCYNSTVIGNTAYHNWRDGLKLRDCDFTVASNNSCFGNNVEGSSAGAEMRLQINENSATGVTVANNTWRSTNPALTASFSVSWVGPGTVCDRLSVVGNNGENMNLAHSDRLLCANNVMSGRIQLASAGAAAPNPQPRARVIGNYAAELFCTNRVTDSIIQANTVDQITTPTDGGNTNNRVLGNAFLAQAVSFERRFFKEFSGNTATITPAVTAAVFREANNASDNSGKIIRDNTITGNTTALIADSVSTVSGDKNIVTGNVSDLSSGASMISMWGSNHVVIGNICTGTSPSSFVGMNNSILFANWPRGGERAGTSGNQNLYYLTGEKTYDPPSLADGDGVTTTVTVTGANFGDFASAAFQHPMSGIVLTAWVSAVDTVSVLFQNESGGVVDLTSGTLRARVYK